MISFRSLLLLSFVAFLVGANASAQQPLFQVPQPVQTQPAGQQRVQQDPIVQQPIQQQRVQQQPMQPFVVQGAQSVYQPNPNQSPPMAQPAGVQGQMGTNFGQQPPRVATTNPGQPVGGQSIQLYNPSGTNQTPQILQPGVQGAQQGIPPGMQHMGSAAPANRIVPFFLNPVEQRELDNFLERWEKYSATINRYEVNFVLHIYDPTIQGAEPNKANKVAFGYFKYIASPRRFVYEVEGEMLGDKQVKRTDNTPNIYAEKIIIDEKSVNKYDYNAKTVHQINVPPDLIGKGIADSPLPLIFGAKAEDLKRRFSMKVVPHNNREDIMILRAKPLLIEDQQEFRELEIFIDKRNLTALGLRQDDINEKAYRSFTLKQHQINPRPVRSLLEDIKEWFTVDVPRGWRLEESNWVAPPPPVPAMQQPRTANPPQNEVPLYRM
ncbi:MAG: hypothetical protein FWE95_07855 [Planctomycetaceae bacterium]|nr:hypothetical protein [Planctomycetaceae bacterium]